MDTDYVSDTVMGGGFEYLSHAELWGTPNAFFLPISTWEDSLKSGLFPLRRGGQVGIEKF